MNVQEDGLPEDTLGLTHTVEVIVPVQHLSHSDPPSPKYSKLLICGLANAAKEPVGIPYHKGEEAHKTRRASRTSVTLQVRINPTRVGTSSRTFS